MLIRPTRLYRIIILVALLTVAGCAGRAPIGDAPDVGEKKDDRLMDDLVCLVVEGDPEVLPDAEDAVWWRDGGTMRCVAATVPPVPLEEAALALTRDEAVEAAAERLLPGAFEMLERRGAALSPSREAEAVEEFARAVTRGETAGFPRIAIRDAVVERCASADGGEHWRAQLLAEYPIGVIRGDVNHTQWDARRLARELEMRVSSGDALIADGRWMDGVFELRRAYDLLALLGTHALTGELAARLAGDLHAPRDTFSPRFSRIEGEESLVLHAGERVSVAYRLTYPLGDEWIGAAGVPVTVEGGSRARAVIATAETDADGEVAFDIIASDEPGDDRLTVVAQFFPDREVFLSERGPRADEGVIATMAQSVIVLSSREATVCVEVDAATDVDADRVREGLSNGLDALGSRLVECGPDASLVVAADVLLSTRETHGTWLAQATCDVRVFDQRLAENVGGVSFEVKESVESAARDADVLALREVGRLIAVYLEPRLAER